MIHQTHAANEFRAAGWTDESGKFRDETQEAICKNALDLLNVFYGQGHSGFSASYVIDLFTKLAKFRPIIHLTGEDWEWTEVSDGIFQNKRCGSVFKDASLFDGQPYDIDGVIFYEYYTDEETGERHKGYFTNKDSAVPITSPYIQETQYKERLSNV